VVAANQNDNYTQIYELISTLVIRLTDKHGEKLANYLAEKHKLKPKSHIIGWIDFVYG
jgi:hypothetical protein